MARKRTASLPSGASPEARASSPRKLRRASIRGRFSFPHPASAEGEPLMAKRSARAYHVAEEDYGRREPTVEVLDDRSEQRFVRKVKPMSHNQRRLMAAIEDRRLTRQLGPAGTGKTYITLAAAAQRPGARQVPRPMS